MSKKIQNRNYHKKAYLNTECTMIYNFIRCSGHLKHNDIDIILDDDRIDIETIKFPDSFDFKYSTYLRIRTNKKDEPVKFVYISNYNNYSKAKRGHFKLLKLLKSHDLNELFESKKINQVKNNFNKDKPDWNIYNNNEYIQQAGNDFYNIILYRK